jgi:Protein of unknown function (DUF2510)
MTTPNQPGWYDDPHDSNAQRYWDGQDWTPHRQRKPSVPAARPQAMPPPRGSSRPPDLPPSSAAPTQAAPLPPPSAVPTQAPPPPPRAAAPTEPAPSRMPPPSGYDPAAAPQGRDVPTQSAAQQWAPPNPQSRGAGPQMASEGLAAAKGFAGRFSVNLWLALGGLVVTVIATFLPFATVSVKLFGNNLDAHDVSANGAAKFIVLLLVALAIFLLFPALTGSQLVVGRLIGLSVVVVLLGALTVVWFNSVSTQNNEGEGVVEVTPGFGLMLYGAAVVVTAVGVVRLWIDRSKTPKPTY